MGVYERWTARLKKRRAKYKAERAETAKQLAEEKAAAEDVEFAERVVARHKAKPQRFRAVAIAKGVEGEKESPAGSNTSPFIRRMAQAVGAPNPPYAWCGLFVWWAARSAGLEGLTSRALYVPFIIEDAKACRNGFAGLVDERSVQAGDFVCMEFDGRSPTGDHVGMATGPARRIGSTWYIPTVEGNTSSSNLGSQSNGGMVSTRLRPLSVVTAVARPKWSS